LVRILVPVYLILIFCVPAGLVGGLWIFLEDVWSRLAFLTVAPLLYAFFYVGTAGLLSLPHQKAVVPGLFPVDLRDSIYGRRRLYGLCWTSVYYFSPIYFLFLSIPFLRRILFRLFGYKGNLDFTVYPDTWIRDLPLLNFGKGAYLSNRATIGTNIRLVNGYIIVDGITVEEGGLVGHLSMLGPGVRIGKKAQIGVGCVVGLKTTIGDGAEVGPGTRLEHGITIGEGARVGPASLVGSGSSLTGQIKLPFGSRIPRKSVLTSQEDVNNYSTLESRS